MNKQAYDEGVRNGYSAFYVELEKVAMSMKGVKKGLGKGKKAVGKAVSKGMSYASKSGKGALKYVKKNPGRSGAMAAGGAVGLAGLEALRRRMKKD